MRIEYYLVVRSQQCKRNEAFMECILVGRAAALFQSPKSREEFSNSTTTWTKISLMTIEFPLLWIYALQTIYKLQILLSIYLNIRKGNNKHSTRKRNNPIINEYTRVLIFFLISYECCTYAGHPQSDPFWKNWQVKCQTPKIKARFQTVGTRVHTVRYK